jgi:hypothetical protein
VKPYAVFLHSDAVNRLIHGPASRLMQLRAFFERIAANPFITGEFKVKDHLDRDAEVKRVGIFPVTYYAGHAVKEVQILGIEPI